MMPSIIEYVICPLKSLGIMLVEIIVVLPYTIIFKKMSGRSSDASSKETKPESQNSATVIDWPHMAYTSMNAWESAIEDLHRAETAMWKNHKDAKARCAVAAALYSLDIMHDAIRVADMAIDMEPGLADAHCVKGAALKVEYRLDEALGVLRHAVKLDPGHWNSWRIMGDVLMLQGDYFGALECFERGLKVNSESPGLHIGRDRALDLLGGEEGVDALRRSLEAARVEAEQDQPQATLASMETQETVIAETTVLETSEESKTRPGYRNPSAEGHETQQEEQVRTGADLEWPQVVYAGTDAWDEANNELRKADAAVLENPIDVKARNDVAVALYILSLTKEAIEAADVAIGLDPGIAETHYIKGIALEAEGMHDEAVDSLRRAIEIEPDHWNSWRVMGGALMLLGEHREALECFERGLDLNPDNPEMRLARARALSRVAETRA